jgi:Holliday junction resolvase RusA-like endonuclease
MEKKIKLLKKIITNYNLRDITKLEYIEDEIAELTENDILKIQKIIEYNEENNKEFKVKFIHYTVPETSQRPRVSAILEKDSKKFKGFRIYDPLSNKEYKYDFRESFLKHVKSNKLIQVNDEDQIKLIKGTFKITAKIFKKIPKEFSKAEVILAEMGYIVPPTAPDTDNAAKNLMDSLKGYIYIDDKLNCKLIIEKHYSTFPRLEFTLTFRYKLIKTKKIK